MAPASNYLFAGLLVGLVGVFFVVAGVIMLPSVLGVLFLVFGVVVLVWGVYRIMRSARSEKPAKGSPSKARDPGYCPHCGSPLSGEGPYCPACGRKTGPRGGP